MTAEMALRLGQAVAQRFRARRRAAAASSSARTRASRATCWRPRCRRASCSAGADVLLVGPLPTPGIAFITSSMRADAGVVISASHNPYQDNGIKFFAADGFKLPDEVEAEIERAWRRSAAGTTARAPSPTRSARPCASTTRVGRYVQFLKHAFPKELTLDGMRIVVDCANGAAYQVAPQVFEELGAEVDDDRRRARRPEHQRRLRRAPPRDAWPSEVRRARARTLGIALDGDADRLILVDEKGNVVDGDQIMAILGTRMLARGQLPGTTRRRDGDVEPRPRARARARRRQAAAHARSAIATSSRRCARAATTSAASSRATSSSSTTRPRATASSPRCSVLAVMVQEQQAAVGAGAAR